MLLSTKRRLVSVADAIQGPGSWGYKNMNMHNPTNRSEYSLGLDMEKGKSILSFGLACNLELSIYSRHICTQNTANMI